ncbi:chemotaxis protein CheW [Emcibacter nanhaiensis]|uniref:Chemotaxis protein CheA n=1 Tax=Emcibacter nanhaiensis TaxID=1505037 RepID=A0A501PPW1_9PROT|nr:chemotaxis protein CheW [Emcibacter nanhaiensis]TPD62004.1 hybrid sensor histidine kinase/response regulator [Emcibacter nanhaiensis]
MDDLLNEFLTETAESIDVVDVELVTLEQDPNNKSVLDNIFRLVHTIKGTCGFLGLPRLESVAHAAENVLGKFRDGEIQVTPDAVTLILASLDRIKEILAGLEATEEEPAGDDSEIISQLNAMASGEAAPAAPVAEVAPEPEPEPEIVSSIGKVPGEVSLEELEAAFQAAPGPDDLDPEEEVAEAPAEEPAPVEETVAVEAPAQEAAAAKGKAGNEPSVATQSIRVNVHLLEDLMNMVSELVLTRNQLMQILRRSGDTEFSIPLQRLSQCTTELQEGVMKTRMQPIGNAWAKLPRIIRDLQVELGKKIDLQMLGADTELDRQVLELIKDPLTHMVRNSADHGIEMPEARKASGKKETGTIRLNAFHEGGHIIIDITDDGAGLAVDKLKAKALKNELATEAELAEMSDQQIQKFIFHPGFSTAEKVTSVSGRGVGMDVVRSNIEKIGGTIDLKSIEGKGTSFSIKIPLTLAIVSALIVKSREERFAIPQISVLELVRTSDDSEHRIEYINDTPVLRLRDRLLPLVYLEKILGVNGQDGEEDAERKEDFIVITQVGAFTFGIVVDQVFDTEEIVVKPVAPILRDLNIYSGNTILGDGSVIMILDPNGIASETGDALSDLSDNDTAQDDSVSVANVFNEKEAILLFRAGDDVQRAVPLSLVARLEEVDAENIESSDGKPVVQYRGQLMPLVKPFDNMQIKESGRQAVLVFSDGDRTMGLTVDEIVDILEDRIDVELSSKMPGQIGTAVINGKATEVIDVAFYIEKAFGKVGGAGTTEKARDRQHILLVDDSPFFLNMIRPLLSAAGYHITAVSTASEALTLRDKGMNYDVIISDIEMPEIDGFSFAEQVRKDGAWQDTPLVALSSRSTPQDFERGREVGFNDYVTKLDREMLLETINQQIGNKVTAA